MKKVIMSLLVLAASMTAMAAYTSKATLTLTGTTSGETCELVIAATTDYSKADMCAIMNMDYRVVALYALEGTNKYQLYGDATISDLALGFMAGAETDYIIKATNVEGAENFVLYDAVSGVKTTLTDGTVYPFVTDGTAATILDRFVINPSHVQTAFVCQVAGGLSFHGDQAYTGLQVLDENDQVVEAAFDLAAGEDKFVAIAAAGRYYIKNGEQKIYFVVK